MKLKVYVEIVNGRNSRPEEFCRKSVLRNFAKFTRKHLRQCFPVNFAKFLRTPFFNRTPLVAASEIGSFRS